jgi:hypothetical protein
LDTWRCLRLYGLEEGCTLWTPQGSAAIRDDRESCLLNFTRALPWFEVVCGLLLLGGIGVRGSALMLLVMLVPFSLIVLQRALAIQTAQAIPFCAIRFDCGCGAGEVIVCHKLLENAFFILCRSCFSPGPSADGASGPIWPKAQLKRSAGILPAGCFQLRFFLAAECTRGSESL